MRNEFHFMNAGKDMARGLSGMLGVLPFRMDSVLPWSTGEGFNCGLESVFFEPKTIESGHYLNSTLGV